MVSVEPRQQIPAKPYRKDIEKNVMMPGMARKRHPFVEDRMRRLAQWAETADINRVEMGGTALGILTSSTCYQYVKEVFGNGVSILKLGMVNPLPEQLIRDFASKVERLVVVEELDPVLETYCKSLGLKVEGKNLFPRRESFHRISSQKNWVLSRTIRTTGRSIAAPSACHVCGLSAPGPFLCPGQK